MQSFSSELFDWFFVISRRLDYKLRLSCNQHLPFYGPFSRKSMHVESLLNLLLNEVLFILNIVYEIYYKHLHEDLLLLHSRNNNFHQLHFFLIFQQARVLYLYLKKTGSQIFFNVCITRILLIWTVFVIKNALYRGVGVSFKSP